MTILGFVGSSICAGDPSSSKDGRPVVPCSRLERLEADLESSLPPMLGLPETDMTSPWLAMLVLSDWRRDLVLESRGEPSPGFRGRRTLLVNVPILDILGEPDAWLFVSSPRMLMEMDCEVVLVAVPWRISVFIEGLLPPILPMASFITAVAVALT